MNQHSPDNGGRLPDFLIIGGMKCGSTTLYEYLSQHPDIYVSENKEPSYFSDDDVFQRGEQWYRSTFSNAGPEQICGEASTSYSRCEEFRIGVKPETWVNYLNAPARIASAVPDVKLIYIMRHPVERAYSHYAFLMQVDAMLTFEQALDHHKTIIETSRYINHIRRFLEHFPREQLLCLILDEFEADTEGVLGQVQSFLEVENISLGREIIHSNPAGSVYAIKRVNRWINSVRQQPFVRGIARLAPKKFRRNIVANTSQVLANSFLGKQLVRQHKDKISPFTEETRAYLLDILEDSTCELETFLGQELPKWHV